MVLHALTSLTETRDFETGAHLVRTSRYARALGEALASYPRFRSFLTPETIDLIARLAPIHDIGKVGVADRTLRKPGPLSEDERAEMSRHPIYGRDVIARTEERVGVRDDFLLKLAKEIVYSHHERWDGSGYPEGLRGEAIPVPGRMVALVDVYDALSSARVYKGALPHDEVVQAIVAGRGVHFDPDMVDAFLGIQEDWRRIAIDFADERRAAVPGLRPPGPDDPRAAARGSGCAPPATCFQLSRSSLSFPPSRTMVDRALRFTGGDAPLAGRLQDVAGVRLRLLQHLDVLDVQGLHRCRTSWRGPPFTAAVSTRRGRLPRRGLTPLLQWPP